jgi:hypothetical protein
LSLIIKSVTEILVPLGTGHEKFEFKALKKFSAKIRAKMFFAVPWMNLQKSYLKVNQM